MKSSKQIIDGGCGCDQELVVALGGPFNLVRDLYIGVGISLRLVNL